MVWCLRCVHTVLILSNQPTRKDSCGSANQISSVANVIEQGQVATCPYNPINQSRSDNNVPNLSNNSATINQHAFYPFSSVTSASSVFYFFFAYATHPAEILNLISQGRRITNRREQSVYYFASVSQLDRFLAMHRNDKGV